MFEGEALIGCNRKVARETFLLGLQHREMAGAAHPGQFVMLRAGNGMDPLLRRPFSICGIGEKGEIYILYRVVGKGTAILSSLLPGARLSVLGPLGRGFDAPVPGEHLLLVSGGMGVAPLLFAAQKWPIDALLAGYRSMDEVTWPEELRLGRVASGISTEDGSVGYRGLVTSLLESKLSGARDGTRICACGPGPMLGRVAEIALAHGLPCQVSLESHMACGLGACLGCAVRGAGQKTYLYVCREGPVFDARDLDWRKP